MKRDWEIVRNILIELENMPHEKSSLGLGSFPEDKTNEYSYHVNMLIESGLIEGSMSRAIGPGVTEFMARRITWAGHDFLDSIRNEGVWSKTKDALTNVGGTMSFEVLKVTAKEVALGIIKASL